MSSSRTRDQPNTFSRRLGKTDPGARTSTLLKCLSTAGYREVSVEMVSGGIAICFDRHLYTPIGRRTSTLYSSEPPRKQEADVVTTSSSLRKGMHV